MTDSDSGHLTAADLIALKDPAFAGAERARIVEHLQQCEECRARADTSEPTTRQGFVSAPRGPVKQHVVDKADLFPRGAGVGRYVILDVLGAGGMGVVYAAFDPELDRKVAVKLLQARPAVGDLSGGQAWLQREAQAMARLAHENVIAIHDVGTLPGDRVFVAMELVDGVTLRAWLKQKKRPWREAVPILVAAGRGLAAAHKAGLVHRDFKPDNVLVGKDGRVKVMDFGLARLERAAGGVEFPDPLAEEGAADIVTQLSPLTADLTAAGTVLGTPAYMAPELFKKSADAKSDQFAFGVALYEALYGQRPFEKDELAAKRTKPLLPKDPPKGADVPARLEKIVRRAVAEKADDRFSSMDALLEELSADPEAARRRALLGAGIVLAVVAAVGGSVAVSAARPPPCTGLDKRLAGVWDPAKQEAVRAAFVATKVPYAEQAYEGAAAALDKITADWVAMSTESCRATRVTGEQTEAVQALRQGCLDARLDEIDALVSLLAKADAALVEKADKAVFALDSLKACANVAALSSPERPPADAASRPKVVALEKKLAEAKAAVDAARFDAAQKAAADAASLAHELHFDAGEAEALLVRGEALRQSGKAKDGDAELGAAAFAGLRSRRDDVAAAAAMLAADTAADALGHDDEAKVWLGLAGAEVARAGNDRSLEQRLTEVEGVVAGARGDFVKAAALHEQALALAGQLYGDGDPALWRSEQLLAATYAKGGAYAKAVPHYERALALKEKASGPEHPDVALILTSLGGCYDHVGDVDKERSALDRALAIREKNFGKESPKLIATLNNMADLMHRTHKLDDALALARRGLAISEKVPGPKHPLTHVVATTLGEILTARGELPEAHRVFDDALAHEEETSSPVLPTTLTSRAALALAENKPADAAAFDERAVVLFEKSGGKEAADLWKPLGDLARARIALGKRTDARPLLERAVAIGTKAEVAAADLAPYRQALAALR